MLAKIKGIKLEVDGHLYTREVLFEREELANWTFSPNRMRRVASEPSTPVSVQSEEVLQTKRIASKRSDSVKPGQPKLKPLKVNQRKGSESGPVPASEL